VSAQLLGQKWLRRAQRITGLTPIRGWAHGGYVMDFVTQEHVHFWIDSKTNQWDTFNSSSHYTSCRQFEKENS
jgi:hypothetical protein